MRLKKKYIKIKIMRMRKKKIDFICLFTDARVRNKKNDDLNLFIFIPT